MATYDATVRLLVAVMKGEFDIQISEDIMTVLESHEDLMEAAMKFRHAVRCETGSGPRPPRRELDIAEKALNIALKNSVV